MNKTDLGFPLDSISMKSPSDLHSPLVGGIHVESILDLVSQDLEPVCIFAHGGSTDVFTKVMDEFATIQLVHPR